MVLQYSRLESLDRGRVVQRPQQGGFNEWVARLDCFVHLLQGAEEFLCDGPVEVQPPGRGAALACCPYCTKEDGGNGHGKVGVGHDNRRVVTTQLKQEFAEPVLHNFAYLTAGGFAAREGDWPGCEIQ